MAVILMYSSSYGQQVIWANKNNLDKKTDFTKIIGQNRHGVYAVKHRSINNLKKYFILQHFDKKMNLLHSKTIKIPEAELQKTIVMSDDIIFFTKQYEAGGLFTLTMQHLDSNLVAGPSINISTGCSLAGNLSDFKVEYSLNRQKMLAYYLSEENNKSVLHLLQVFKDKAGTRQDVKLDYPFEEIDINKTLIDRNGNFYCLYTVSKNFKSSKAADYVNYFLRVDIQEGKLRRDSFHNYETFITNNDLSYNPNTDKVHATGFYGKKDEDDNYGFFDIAVNPQTFDIEHKVFTPIDRKTVASIIGTKYEQKGDNITKLTIRKTIPRMDGGCMIIAERFFITTQSDVFYVNGMPQTSYAKIFNNDELLVLSLDSTGHQEWAETVIKNQSSINDGGYFNGIIIMVNDNNVNIIFNDRLSANADVTQITFRPNGEHTKKILLNSDQYYALVIPSECSQVSSNSIVLPVNQNRDYTYIKLVY